jgi:hypothetical protein
LLAGPAPDAPVAARRDGDTKRTPLHGVDGRDRTLVRIEQSDLVLLAEHADAAVISSD